eukprot:scaffold10545_cov131-Isochrysis_galbana.AAC.4
MHTSGCGADQLHHRCQDERGCEIWRASAREVVRTRCCPLRQRQSRAEHRQAPCARTILEAAASPGCASAGTHAEGQAVIGRCTFALGSMENNSPASRCGSGASSQISCSSVFMPVRRVQMQPLRRRASRTDETVVTSSLRLTRTRRSANAR